MQPRWSKAFARLQIVRCVITFYRLVETPRNRTPSTTLNEADPYILRTGFADATQAGEDSRTPKAGANAFALLLAPASWSAAVLCRFCLCDCTFCLKRVLPGRLLPSRRIPLALPHCRKSSLDPLVVARQRGRQNQSQSSPHRISGRRPRRRRD